MSYVIMGAKRSVRTCISPSLKNVRMSILMSEIQNILHDSVILVFLALNYRIVDIGENCELSVHFYRF